MPGDKPSAWAVEAATKLTPVQCGFKGGSDLGWHGTRDAIALALDAAEQRGFERAVNETAIASIHKAVAAERAAIVAWLRAEAERCASACSRGSHDAGIGMVVLRARADAIERGEHHPKETKP